MKSTLVGRTYPATNRCAFNRVNKMNTYLSLGMIEYRIGQPRAPVKRNSLRREEIYQWRFELICPSVTEVDLDLNFMSC